MFQWYVIKIFNKTFYCNISQSLEDARFVFRIERTLWNLTGTSPAVLPMCLLNFKAMRQFKLSISRLRGSTIFYDKTYFLSDIETGPIIIYGSIHSIMSWASAPRCWSERNPSFINIHVWAISGVSASFQCPSNCNALYLLFFFIQCQHVASVVYCK